MPVLVVGCSFGGSDSGRNVSQSPTVCELGPRSELYVALETMPKAVMQDFVARLAAQTADGLEPIVGRDQPFQRTDAGETQPISPRRFIQGGRLGERWIVLYEKGGGGGPETSVHAVLYELHNREAAPILKAHVEVPAKSLCQTAMDLLSGRDEADQIIPDW